MNESLVDNGKEYTDIAPSTARNNGRTDIVTDVRKTCLPPTGSNTEIPTLIGTLYHRFPKLDLLY